MVCLIHMGQLLIHTRHLTADFFHIIDIDYKKSLSYFHTLSSPASLHLVKKKMLFSFRALRQEAKRCIHWHTKISLLNYTFFSHFLLSSWSSSCFFFYMKFCLANLIILLLQNWMSYLPISVTAIPLQLTQCLPHVTSWLHKQIACVFVFVFLAESMSDVY